MPLSRFKAPSSSNRLAKARQPRGRRFILTIGDEGAILLFMAGSKVMERSFAQNIDSEEAKTCLRMMEAQPDVPIRVVLDTLDQSYIQQTLPPVTSFSVNKIIQRRLQREFAAEEIKGAFSLGREKGARKDWNFLMLAVQQPPAIKAWIERILQLKNPCEALTALPVECARIVKTLHAQLRERNKQQSPAPMWQFLISHNKVSGIRQVILKQGKVIFTRLAQSADDSNPAIVAGTIEQEAFGTIEYMKRLAFRPQDGLEIIILAADAILPLINPSKFSGTTIHTLSPHAAATLLGLSQATTPGDRYGDVALAAAIGMEKRLVLPLVTPAIQEQRRYITLHSATRYAGLAVTLSCLAYIGYSGFTGYESRARSEVLGTQLQAAETRLASLQEQASTLDQNIDTLSDLITLHKLLSADTPQPLLALKRLSDALDETVRIVSVQWAINTEKPATNAAAAPMPDAISLPPSTEVSPTPPNKTFPVKMQIMLEFNEFNQPSKEFVAQAETVRERIKKAFANSAITAEYVDLPGTFKDTQPVQLGSNTASNTAASSAEKKNNPLQVQLVVTGAMP